MSCGNGVLLYYDLNQIHLQKLQQDIHTLQARVDFLENELSNITSGGTFHEHAYSVNPSAGKITDYFYERAATAIGYKTATMRLKEKMKLCFQNIQTGGVDALIDSLRGKYKQVKGHNLVGDHLTTYYIPDGDSSYYEGIMDLCAEIWPNKKFESENMWLDVFDILQKEYYTRDKKGNPIPQQNWEEAMRKFYKEMKSGQQKLDNYSIKFGGPKLVSQALDAATTYMRKNGIAIEQGN